jgi:NADH-quinone oxidoreductase subunit H
MLPSIVEALVKVGLLIGGLMTAAAYLVLLERWIAAWVQDRLGPNRVGIPLTKIKLFGLGQPMADGGKFIFKSDFTPEHVDKAMYLLAPAAIFIAALAAFAAIPFGSVLPGFLPESWGLDQPIQLVVAPGLDVGMIYVLAVGSIAVYGVVLGGWASNNKYSFLGGLRSSAQLISYELPLGLGLLGVVLASGSLRLDVIMAQQADAGVWNVVMQPLGFVVFCVAGFAEAARLPFDLPEAEQELVGGYHTEYSGLKLLMYLVAEFLHMVTAALLIVILYFGGWHFWGLTDGLNSPGGSDVAWPAAIARIVVLLGKTMLVILFFMLARWSWPRFRYDQLMDLGWKVMLPWGMVNMVVVAVGVEYGGRWAAAWGLPAGLLTAGLGWVALALTWWVTTRADPTATDNRPRRQVPA